MQADAIEPWARRHKNWLAGEERGAVGGGSFDLRAPGTRDSLGSWPRSGREDLRAAVVALGEAQDEWSRHGLRERRSRTEEAFELALELLEAEALAPFLGLDAEELAPALRGSVARARTWVQSRSRKRSRAQELVCFAPPWTDLLVPLGRCLALLMRGEAVVWAADPALPLVAASLADALEETSPGAPLAVLHGMPVTGTQSLGELAREQELELISLPAARGRRTLVVKQAHDPVRAALAAAHAAFDRGAAWGGQRPGQLGRIVCHARHFSALSETLLVELERRARAWEPPAPVQAGAAQRHADLVERGLDEGATLIWGELPARWGPAVLTNVEPGSATAREQQPDPLIVLLRAPDDAAAEELARAFAAQ